MWTRRAISASEETVISAISIMAPRTILANDVCDMSGVKSTTCGLYSELSTLPVAKNWLTNRLPAAVCRFQKSSV
jgi:hypothetical protein